MSANWIMMLSIAFAFMLASGLLWMGARMNAQIKRYRDAPTPKAAFSVLVDLQNADQMTISGLEIRVNRMETELVDLHALFRKHQSRDAAQQRRDNELDLKDIEKYIEKVVSEPETDQTSEPTQPDDLEEWR